MKAKVLLLAIALAATAVADERGAIRAFEAAKRTDPELMAFFSRMPKGGDLHNHVSGAIYSDSMLDAAIAKGLFFDPATSRFGADSTKVPAIRLLSDNRLLYQFLNAASMRGWRGGGQSGHDHFFDTFGIFGGALDAMTEEQILAEAIGRAKLQNLQYMELMASPAPDDAFAAYMKELPSSADMAAALETLKPKLSVVLAATRINLDKREAIGALIGQRSLTGPEEPITIRWIHSINRLAGPDSFFANAALGIYLAANEPRVVAMNMVAPEDHPLSRTQFESQMRMIDFLWKSLGKPNLTLHGGELTSAISPPEVMRDRIRKTIDIGHAKRIGHGVSIAWENDLDGLFANMRRDGIAVEICLSSNASILGVSGPQHPLKLYRRAGIPVFLNTDDEGVSRSTMTQEWIRGVREQDLSYLDLKEMARNSIEYSFLSGRSLYESHNYARILGPLKDATKPTWKPNPAVQRLLDASEKMRVQLRLEQAFANFERRY
ncbi:MAG: adenosine deaminase [Fimbriimonas sp.]